MEAALLVTRASTVTILAHRLGSAVRGFVLVSPVVTRVATSTIGLVSWILPGDYFRVAQVAIGTQQIAAMILRLISKRRVAIISRGPRVRAVTNIALFCGAEVILVLTDRVNAIVTRSTRAEYLRVIDRKHRRKHVGRVAVFANIRSLNMCRVFAGCVSAVVAAGTVAGDIHVVEIRWQPASRAVTVIAVIATGDVCRRLTGGDDAIMTSAASADHLGVIDNDHGHKHGGAVAVFTNICRVYMRRVLAGCRRTVMTVYAAARNGCMIERRRQPACGGVAIITGISAGNVCRCLAGGDGTVMAGSAGANDLGVIYGKCRREYIGCMTVLADIR